MNDPLADLKDIHLPEAISWWPLAPGWWILLLLGITSIALVILAYRYWCKHKRYRRHALKLLSELEAQSLDDHTYLTQVAQLITRTAAASPNKQLYDNKSGTQLKTQLQSFMSESMATLIALDRYKANTSYSRQQLFDETKIWIKQHP